MNITDIKKALPILMRNRVVPFLWGQQGVGKTQVVRSLTKELGVGFVHLHLATQEVGDLVGLLVHGKDGTVRHSRPEWFPTEGKGIIFLDELNRCHPDVMQAMFSFITEGTIHQHRLPAGWSIVAAGNFQSDMFNVTDTSDAAWMSRFCHIDFDPTPEEFVLFAEEKEAFSVADFIRQHRELVEHKQKDRLKPNMVTPDRRSWLDMIGKLEKEYDLEDVRYEIYSGIVGQTAAATFLTFKRKAEERLSGRDVLENYPGVRRRILESVKEDGARFDLLNTAVEEIFGLLPKMELDERKFENFKAFLLDIPLEMSLKVVKKLHEITFPQKNKILNNKDFVELFKKTKLLKK